MFKVITKTALKVLIAVIIAAGISFGVASLGFPREMAALCEKCGNYSFAVGYASLSYSYSGKTEDLARCMQDSILAGNDKNVIKFGNQLLDDKGFDDYAADMSGALKLDYRQYIYGKLASSLYRTGGKAKAVEIAAKAVENRGFPINNAVAVLAVAAVEANDGNTADKLSALMDTIVPAENETEYYDKIKEILNGIYS